MSDFRFANPNWAHAVWIVFAIVALLFWLDMRRSDLLSRFVSTTMQQRLVHRLSRTQRWASIACLGLSGLFLVLALMRPQWGLTYREMPRVGAQIMVCLDVSKSMLAEDTAPNRLQRAKAELTDLLSYLEGDQIGLIAFAGKASVLCPLTPDFGFFKLVLDEAGPHSVGRGGTRLEEPIRKALDGFRTESDVSRILILITDGEDHDSHPLDAAKAAAERGVRMLTIGFGDEAGSEIYVTDPQSGVRAQIRDSDGRAVITRLDGQMLRDMALATDGAYIPAGTGALDLKSIHDAHIAPLVRGRLDHRGQAVRRDAFQWAVLAGFVFLIGSIVIGSGSVKSELHAPAPRGASSASAVALSLMLSGLVVLSLAHPSHAQTQSAADQADGIAADGVADSKGKADDLNKNDKDRGSADSNPRDARQIYNSALAYLEHDFESAERLLTDARRQAGTDGDVRFHATYNLGWVEVKKADQRIGDEPELALEHLRRAADWFRDAVRLRPDHIDARHNLEVVLRRVLELSDSLNSDQRDLARQLDELIQAQRGLVGAARQVVDRIAAVDDPNAADQFRADFRQLAVQQRKMLSDSQSVSRSAREELDVLNGKKEEEKTPQDRVRAAQLTGLLYYTNRANQRLGQARSQMRRRQDQRSFRRAAAGLSELKRGRDQLRHPVGVLDTIIADSRSLIQLTALKATNTGITGHPIPASEKSNEAAATDADRSAEQLRAELPAWLTRDYLDESQLSLSERTAELTSRLQSALDAQDAEPAGRPPPDQPQSPAANDAFLSKLREAVPLLQAGQEAFQAAGRSLASDRFDEAAAQQLRAVAALRDARERFLDLPGLIELAHARESEMQQRLARPPEDVRIDTTDQPGGETSASQDGNNGGPMDQRLASVDLVLRLQSDNTERAKRLATLVDDELRALPNPPNDRTSTTNQSPPDAAVQQAAAERQRLELADGLVDQIQSEMAATAKSLAQAKSRSGATDDALLALDEAHQHATAAVEHLQSLRRLFYSIVEHLRETAQRQADLNDESEQVAGLEQGDDRLKKLGPLTRRQQELRMIAAQIGNALHEQAEQQRTADQQGVDPQQLQQLQQIAEQFANAGQLVTEASQEMQQAAARMSAGPNVPPERTGQEERDASEEAIDREQPQPRLLTAKREPQLNLARENQDTALRKMVEALALLQPPQQQPQAQQPQQQQEQGDGQDQDSQPNEDELAAGTDPARLLQSVRDREAARRRNRQRQRFEREPVDKDW